MSKHHLKDSHAFIGRDLMQNLRKPGACHMMTGLRRWLFERFELNGDFSGFPVPLDLNHHPVAHLVTIEDSDKVVKDVYRYSIDLFDDIAQFDTPTRCFPGAPKPCTIRRAAWLDASNDQSLNAPPTGNDIREERLP